MNEERKELETKLAETEEKLKGLQADCQEWAKKCLEGENKNFHLTNLYVACCQLHACLDPEAVKQAMVEITINILGSESFSVFIYDDSITSFVLSFGAGVEGSIGTEVKSGDNFITRVYQERKLYLASKKDEAEGLPRAALPLLASDRAIGVMIIHRLLPQKDDLAEPDLDLLQLLMDHAGVALEAAVCFSKNKNFSITGV